MAGLDGLPDAAERLNADAMAVHAVIRDARIAERANIGRAKTGAVIRLAEEPRADRYRGSARPKARDHQSRRQVSLLSTPNE
jgi:hypothetical protein